VDRRRAGPEQDPVGVFHDGPFDQIPVLDEARVEIEPVGGFEQVDPLDHQLAVQRVAAEVCEDDRNVVLENRRPDRLGRESLAAVDE